MNQKIVLPVSVLIPTMNRPDTLKRTLDSYLSADCLPGQIVIVDQSEKEDTKKYVEALIEKNDCNQIKFDYVYQPTPSSTQARNTAMEKAKEELFIFSDDDIDIYPDTIKNIYERFQDPQIAMIAGIDDNRKKSSSNIGFLLGTKSYKNRKIGHVTLSMLGRYPDDIKDEIETQWAMGYFFVIRKSLAQKWNIRWDENLTSYAYAEDLDFSYSYYKMAQKEGLHCALNEKIRVKHMVSHEYRIPSKKSTYMYVVNRMYLSYKHKMGLKSRVAMGWCNLWRLAERIVKREKPSEMFGAIVYSVMHGKQIKSGILRF